MFWSLDTDDFDGQFCGDVAFPLVSAAVDQFAAPLPKVVEPIRKNEARLKASETNKTKTASTGSTVETNSKEQNDIKPLKNVSNVPTLSQKLKKARTLDAQNKNKGEKNATNVDVGVTGKVGVDIVKTENKNIASKNVIDTIKEIKSTETTSNIRGSETTDKSSLKPKDNIRKKNEKQGPLEPKVKAKSNKQNKHLQGQPQVKIENKNNKINIVKNRKPAAQNPKRKRPQRGRKRKQWRRRRPPPRGRRRQRKRNFNKMGKIRKTVQKKAKPQAKKQSKTNPSSFIKTDVSTTSKPEKKLSSEDRKNI